LPFIGRVVTAEDADAVVPETVTRV
jgi:hypothetical protein